jgi:hypothetical protein
LSTIAGPCVLPFCECHIASPIVTAAPIRATAIVMWLVVGFGLKRFITQKLRACRPVPVRFTQTQRRITHICANEPPRPQSAGAGKPRHNLRPVAGCLWFPAPWLSRSGAVLSEQRNPRRPERLSRWRSCLPTRSGTGRTMQQRLHWLDYDPVALAALVFGMGMIALLALSI